MRLPNPYTLEETLGKLRHGLTAVSNEDALALLEKAVAKAHDDEAYASSLKRPCCGDPPSRSASVSVALATTSSAPETYRPITRITMPSTALIVRSTPSCSMQLTQTQRWHTNNMYPDRRITCMPITFPPDNPDHQTRIIRSNTMIWIFRHNP